MLAIRSKMERKKLSTVPRRVSYTRITPRPFLISVLVVNKVGDTAKKIDHVNINPSGALNTITIQKNIPILKTDLTCSGRPVGFTANVDINVDTDIQANVGYAFLLNGTIIPPKIDDVALAAVMSGKAHAIFNIDALLSGKLDTGELKLFELGIPGLSFPGILNLGPLIALGARGIGDLDIAMSMKVPVRWDFPQFDVVIPPSKGKAFGDAAHSNNTANLEMHFNQGNLTGSVEIHLIPKLEFGIDALNGLASALVFLAADADGRVDLNATVDSDFSMDGCTSGSVGINVNAGGRCKSPVSRYRPDPVVPPSERILPLVL
jgi:hypothetical protein